MMRAACCRQTRRWSRWLGAQGGLPGLAALRVLHATARNQLLDGCG